MDFQERMSSTAHQREVADLRKAGLNPVLSATGGSGASTPQGTSFGVGNPVSSAIDAYYRLKDIQNQTDLKDAQTLLAQAQAVNTSADTTLKSAATNQTNANIGLITGNTDLVHQNVQNARAQNALIRQNVNTAYETERLTRAKANNEFFRIPRSYSEAKFWDEHGSWLPAAEFGVQSGSSALDMLLKGKRLFKGY